MAQVYALAGDIVSHSWESRNAPSHFVLQKREMSTALMGHLAHMQPLSLLYSKLHALMKANSSQNDGVDVKDRMYVSGSYH